MKLVNMKQEPEKPTQAVESSSMKHDAPAYPYGLKLYLDAKSIAKLGLKELPKVGAKMHLEATVEVCDISMNESQLYGENKSMGIQITDMSLGKGDESSEDSSMGSEERPERLMQLKSVE